MRFEMLEVVERRIGLRFGLFLSPMHFAVNRLCAEGGAAVVRSLRALTALQTLNFSCKAPCFVLPCEPRRVRFEEREGVVRKSGLRLSAFVSLMLVAVNDFSAEGGAAVGRLLTALTALQTLNFWGKAPVLWGCGLKCV